MVTLLIYFTYTEGSSFCSSMPVWHRAYSIYFCFSSFYYFIIFFWDPLKSLLASFVRGFFLPFVVRPIIHFSFLVYSISLQLSGSWTSKELLPFSFVFFFVGSLAFSPLSPRSKMSSFSNLPSIGYEAC